MLKFSQKTSNLSRNKFSQLIIILTCCCAFLFTAQKVHARESAGGGDGGDVERGNVVDKVANTQKKRSAERFDIISWINANKAKTSEQDRKYGRTGGSKGWGPTVDLVFSGFQEKGEVSRTVEGSGVTDKIGTDTFNRGRLQMTLNSLFTAGDRDHAYDLDLGFEVFGGRNADFAAATPPIQTERGIEELGYGILFRPIGRSSQDTGFLIKVGQYNLNTKGIWTSALELSNAKGLYWGIEAKLYLLPFLGVEGEYTTVPSGDVTGGLKGSWTMSRKRYGAFLELWLIHLGAYLATQDIILTPEVGSKVTESYPVQGMTASIHF